MLMWKNRKRGHIELKLDVPEGPSSLIATNEEEEVEVVAFDLSRPPSPMEHIPVPITWLKPNERTRLGVLRGKPMETRGLMTLDELHIGEREMEVGILHNHARNMELYRVMEVRQKAREIRLRSTVTEEDNLISASSQHCPLPLPPPISSTDDFVYYTLEQKRKGIPPPNKGSRGTSSSLLPVSLSRLECSKHAETTLSPPPLPSPIYPINDFVNDPLDMSEGQQKHLLPSIGEKSPDHYGSISPSVSPFRPLLSLFDDLLTDDNIPPPNTTMLTPATPQALTESDEDLQHDPFWLSRQSNRSVLGGFTDSSNDKSLIALLEAGLRNRGDSPTQRNKRRDATQNPPTHLLMRSLSSSESNDDTTILRIRHRKRVTRQETPKPTRATRRRLISSDEEAEQRTTFQYNGVTYTHPRFMPFVEDTDALYIDIDSLRIAVSAPDLLQTFPIYSLAQLSSTRHLHRQLKQYTHVGTAVGYQMYVKTLPFATKKSVCEYISRIGPLVHPSKKIGVFITGKIVCPSGQLLEALIATGITILVIEAYGQKAPLHTVQLLANIQVDDPLLQVRVDIGINGSCTGIPLFSTSSGRTYPMLYLVGSSCGSTTTHLQSLRGHHRVIVYPRLVHHTKAYFRTSLQRPSTNKALKKKRKYMETAVTDLIATNDLTGYRVEHQHFGRYVVLADLLQDLPLQDASLPEGVVCKYHFSQDLYKTIISEYWQFIQEKGLFRGRNHHTCPSWKLTDWARMINIIGLYKWQMRDALKIGSRVTLPPLLTMLTRRRMPQPTPHLNPVSCENSTHPTSNGSDSEDDRNVLDLGSVQNSEDSDFIGEENAALLTDIKTFLRVRKHPRSRKLCATRRNGGWTTSFNTVQELSRYIMEQFGPRWKKAIVTRTIDDE